MDLADHEGQMVQVVLSILVHLDLPGSRMDQETQKVRAVLLRQGNQLLLVDLEVQLGLK